VEPLIRQTHTPQGKSLTDRPVFHIIVQGTYNRLCGIQHNRFWGGPGAVMRPAYPTTWPMSALWPRPCWMVYMGCCGRPGSGLCSHSWT